MCGSTEIDGYTFCTGLRLLNLSYAGFPDLQISIRSITYLIRNAIFRPKHPPSGLGNFLLNIYPLGDLVDMYHTSEATDLRDKVFALLNMSSEDPSTTGISPNYHISWKEIFQQLIKSILGAQVCAETWDNKQITVIKSKGSILGQVSLVQSRSTWDDQYSVTIAWKPTIYLGQGHCAMIGKRTTKWTFRASAKPISKGDILCLLQGASKPTIIRLRKDYVRIVMISVSPFEDMEMKNTRKTQLKDLQPMTEFLTDFLLLWDWKISSAKSRDPEEYETLQENGLVPEH